MDDLLNTTKSRFQSQISDLLMRTKIPEGVNKALSASVPVMTKFGSPQNKIARSEGGLHFMTYKAVVQYVISLVVVIYGFIYWLNRGY
jgi:Na+/H+ antiporter NhaB